MQWGADGGRSAVAGGGDGTNNRGGKSGTGATNAGDAGTPETPLCSQGPWATPGSTALYGRDGTQLHAITAGGSIATVPFPVEADQVLGNGSTNGNVTTFSSLPSGAVHTTTTGAFTAFFADESLRDGMGRAKHYAAALFDDRGRPRYAVSGTLTGPMSDNYVSRLRLSDEGTLVADYLRGSDFVGREPIPDLSFDASGHASNGFFPIVDIDGWTFGPFGLYHAASGEVRAAPATLRQTHLEHGGLFAVAYVEVFDSTSRITVFDGRSEAGYDFPLRLTGYDAATFMAPGLIRVMWGGRPMYRLDTIGRRVSPLLAEIDAERLTTSRLAYSTPYGDTYHAQIWDDAGENVVDSFLVDPLSGTVVRLSSIGAQGAAAVDQSREAWFVSEQGVPRWRIRRDTGTSSALRRPPSTEVTFVRTTVDSAERRFYLSGGIPWAVLDLDVGELREFTRASTAELDAVDAVEPHGEFLIGSASGIPRWISRNESGRFVRLPTASELEVGEGAGYAGSGRLLPNSYARATDWLVIHEAGLPRVAIALDGVTVRRLDPDAAAELAPADHIRVEGEWAFGLVRLSAEEGGQDWFAGYRVAWRIHLPSGRVTVVPGIAGYRPLFDPRYVIAPGTLLEHYISGEDFVFSDGVIAAVRRDDAAARVFVMGADSASWTPIGEPFTHVVSASVEHGRGYFLVSPYELACYCTSPTLDWGTGEPDASRQHQLVLVEGDSMRTITGGTWTFTRDNSCVAVSSETAGHFARDFESGATTTLPRAGAWHWIEPE